MNRSLKTLYFTNSIFVFAASLLGPLYAVYVEKITDNLIAVSMTWSIFLISSLIFTFVVSRVGDRVKEKEYMLMAGFLIRSAVWIGYIFVPNLGLLIVAQVFLGLGESLGSPAFMALIAEHLDKGKHIKDYANWSMLSHLVAAISTMFGGWLIVNYGFNTVFIGMATLALISFFILLVQPRDLL